ncbi:hypothetical protein [uncultured Friedmanniella sp.]|uniref:hypothetical protein n=1 Tax=uncultured Friedmanniella sp. TaxID=335381 RepID=UPI0035CB883D
MTCVSSRRQVTDVAGGVRQCITEVERSLHSFGGIASQTCSNDGADALGGMGREVSKLAKQSRLDELHLVASRWLANATQPAF